MNAQYIRSVEAQLLHVVSVIETAKRELSNFQFKDVSDTLAQLGGEIQWIREQVHKALKDEST